MGATSFPGQGGRGQRETGAAPGCCSRGQEPRPEFFDYNHGQTGVAPNAIELHPILGFACLSG